MRLTQAIIILLTIVFFSNNQNLLASGDETFKNLKPQGFMKVRLPNGQKYDGVWTDGQMQRAFSVRNRRNSETVYRFH